MRLTLLCRCGTTKHSACHRLKSIKINDLTVRGLTRCKLRRLPRIRGLARRERLVLLVLHFDPRNLSKLYVPDEGDYLEVPFADLRLPPSIRSLRRMAQ